MKRFGFPWCWLVMLPLAVGGVGLVGCDKPAEVAAPPVSLAMSLPTEAQPRLPTMKLWIGPKEMQAELALTPVQEQTGMMFRTNMAENDGMLFVLDPPQRASFWMMNCSLPLSAAYIDPAGAILEIHELKPHDTNSVVAAADNVQFVLETPLGWFERNKIPVGTIITTEKGPLHKVFLER
jgi:uncharacterized membrane protein (UPF0127 family)